MTKYPDIHLTKDNAKYDWWRVVEPVRVVCHLVESGRIIIGREYTTDFASVPQVFWWLIPPHGVTSSACVVHDYLYENKIKGVKRKQVDDFWLGLLKESSAPRWQVWLMYGYVRAFGWWTWNRA